MSRGRVCRVSEVCAFLPAVFEEPGEVSRLGPRVVPATASGHQIVPKGAISGAKIYGRCDPTTGIEPTVPVEQVVTQEPYKSADRVFRVVEVEVYLSNIQRKAFSPNDFTDST